MVDSLETMSLSSNNKIFIIPPFLLRKKQSFLFFIQRSLDPSHRFFFHSPFFPAGSFPFVAHIIEWPVIYQAKIRSEFGTSFIHRSLIPPILLDQLYLCLRPFKWRSELKIRTSNTHTAQSALWLDARERERKNVFQVTIFVVLGADTFAFVSFLCRFRSPEKMNVWSEVSQTQNELQNRFSFYWISLWSSSM